MMSDVQVGSQFERRPSGKQRRNIGKKRNFDEMSDTNHQASRDSASNPNKKRRLLTYSEISDIAKFGGFNPNHIVLAVQESDGFCWFRRQSASEHTTITTITPVLRELTEDELKQKTAQAHPELRVVQVVQVERGSLNLRNKQRRHTAPTRVLRDMRHSQIDEATQTETETEHLK